MGIVKMDIQTWECKSCGKQMIKKPSGQSPFPIWFGNDFDAQCKKLNLEIRSGEKIDGCAICMTCVRNGKAVFVCALCKETMHTNEIQESFGDPPDSLCRFCYEARSAKEWIEKTKELSKIHRYDFD